MGVYVPSGLKGRLERAADVELPRRRERRHGRHRREVGLELGPHIERWSRGNEGSDGGKVDVAGTDGQAGARPAGGNARRLSPTEGYVARPGAFLSFRTRCALSLAYCIASAPYSSETR